MLRSLFNGYLEKSNNNDVQPLPDAKSEITEFLHLKKKSPSDPGHVCADAAMLSGGDERHSLFTCDSDMCFQNGGLPAMDAIIAIEDAADLIQQAFTSGQDIEAVYASVHPTPTLFDVKDLQAILGRIGQHWSTLKNNPAQIQEMLGSETWRLLQTRHSVTKGSEACFL